MITVFMYHNVPVQDMGTVVMGKVESGGVAKGSILLLMPNRVSGVCVYLSSLNKS